MFPSTVIESFYQNFKKGAWDSDELVAVAKLCEEWIFSLEPMPDFIAKTLSAVNTPGSNPSLNPLYWAFGMALCIPSARTGDLFQARHDFLVSNRGPISECVVDISNALNTKSGHRVDLLTAFSHLPGPEYFQTAYECYSTDVMFIEQVALAWDNLPVFLGTLPKTRHYSSKAFTLIGGLHNPEGTSIYQHFVVTREDQKALFREQIKALRKAVMGDYEGYMHWVNTGPKIPTLMPNTSAKRAHQHRGKAVEIFRQPDFASRLIWDEKYLVNEFFQPMDGVLRKPQNAPVVHAISRAFIDAGITPASIIRDVILKRVPQALSSIEATMGSYVYFTEPNKDFYREVFRLHLEQFTPDEILAGCRTEVTLEASYKLTGMPELLQACSPRVRDACFGSALGL